jgi:type III pantothenate kinase
MKTLLLDAGNSRLKWALCEHGELSQQGGVEYEWPRLAAQLDASFTTLAVATGRLDGVLLCNVAGNKLEVVLRKKLATHWLPTDESAVHRVQETTSLTIKNVIAQADAYGVRNAYQQPAQLGADRWAGLVAARQHCVGLTCIIDCGTALTVDVLTEEGVHAGGIIVPGMEMMIESLIENTDGIASSGQAEVSPLAVTNTADAVQAGVVAAMRGAVQQMLQYCRDEIGEEPTCVLTGGKAERLLSALPSDTIYDPDWLFKGLAIIAAGNTRQAVNPSVNTGSQSR